jgi:hypothetical protein
LSKEKTPYSVSVDIAQEVLPSRVDYFAFTLGYRNDVHDIFDEGYVYSLTVELVYNETSSRIVSEPLHIFISFIPGQRMGWVAEGISRNAIYASRYCLHRTRASTRGKTPRVTQLIESVGKRSRVKSFTVEEEQTLPNIIFQSSDRDEYVGFFCRGGKAHIADGGDFEVIQEIEVHCDEMFVGTKTYWRAMDFREIIGNRLEAVIDVIRIMSTRCGFGFEMKP